MSNLDVGFFNDSNVPMSAKLGATAMMLRATPHYNKRGVNKNILVFEAELGYNSRLCPVLFEMGNADSAGNLNIRSIAKMLSSSDFDCEGIVEGKYDDEKVAEMCASEFKSRHKEHFNDTSLKDNVSLISKRLGEYFDTWFVQDPTTFNPVVKENADKCITEMVDVYNNGGIGKTARAKKSVQTDDKKKQITAAAPAQA